MTAHQAYWATAILVALVACAVGVWCWPNRPQDRPPQVEKQVRMTHPPSVPTLSFDSSETPSPFRFVSVAREAGINFTYYGSPSPEHYMTEQNGGGISLFDYDGDGRLDVFLVNGSHFDHPAEQVNASNSLFRAVGDWHFEEVTLPARLDAFGMGMGSAAADYDNDGFVDLFVCYYGRNRLWHNNGDGTFSDVTAEAGVDDPRWASSAAFADLDGDGNLDLYVVNYVMYAQDNPPCYTQNADHPIQILCGPKGVSGQADLLYRNRGDGRFEDVSEQGGIALAERGKGLAVQIVDFNDDGRLDIFVANDTTENFLFHNLGQLRFEEVGVQQGVAVGSDGRSQSGMGIACADYNGDGRFDLFVTNFAGAVNDFYENLGAAGFTARNAALGLDSTTRPMLSFGTVFADFDLDQWPDLFIANGHIWDLTPLSTDYNYEMPAQIFLNDHGRRFVDVSRGTAGKYFQQRWLGRAVAVGDLDNDGDPDLVVSHLAKPVGVLRNESTDGAGSIRLKLIGVVSARQPLGARVDVTVSGTRRVTHVPAGGSFQSTSDDRLLIATGNARRVDEIRVHWPNGTVEVWKDLPIRRELVLIEGTGRLQSSDP